MDHYIDIVITKQNQKIKLLNSVYNKVHLKLVNLKSTSVGISFPKYDVVLGDIIRLHGSETDLQPLLDKEYLQEYNRSIYISGVSKVPENTQYRTISRIQPSMSASKLRRLIKQGKLDKEQAKQYRIEMCKKSLDNPYLNLYSHSTKRTYMRFVQFGEVTSIPSEGSFDSYGMSKNATIPWF